MSAKSKIQFSVEIDAPVADVFRIMLDHDGYKDWTTAFCDGSYYAGDWAEGAQIRFMSPSGDGMLSEIAEHRHHEFISIRHLGYISQGVPDTDSDSVRAWAPAYENYTFIAAGNGTTLVVDQDVTAEHEQYLLAAWPKALNRLKELCEAPSTPLD